MLIYFACCALLLLSIETTLGDTNFSSGTATSGKLFKGEKVAEYKGQRKFDKVELNHKALKHEFKLNSLRCDKWAVVTTIFEPSDAIKRQAQMPDWCLVVVGDKKGPKSFNIEVPLKNFVFLTVALQEKMQAHFPLLNSLPWNHFGRKNVGYLYAILHGAQVVWDFDDDNKLISENHKFIIPGMASEKEKASVSQYFSSLVEPNSDYDSLVFNPYPLMRGETSTPAPSCWPRGYPLDRIKKWSINASAPEVITMHPVLDFNLTDIGIIQYLANYDPDVDAIYRLTQPMPLNFPLTGPMLLVPKGILIH